MPRSACTISFRLAGVCRTCKRATWPAHIASDLSVYCADCCEACRPDRAPVENLRAKTARRRTVRSARPGKGGGDTGPPEPGPCCAVSGPARDAASVKRPKPPQGAKAGRRIADRPKTGSQSALWRALLHCRGRGGGGVLAARKRGRQRPFLAPRVLPGAGRGRVNWLAHPA
jgi:hypothetical protein